MALSAAASRLIEEEMTLRELRKAHEFTQERIAEALHINQDGVSRLEKRSDFLLSALRSYLEAMGGKLRLVVDFPNCASVTFTSFESLTKNEARNGRKSGTGTSAPT